MTAELRGTVRPAPELAAGLETGPRIVVELAGSGPPGTTDHRKLEGREAADQHPIGAITGLERELAAQLTAEDVSRQLDRELTELTNQDILRIWNSIE